MPASEILTGSRRIRVSPGQRVTRMSANNEK